jgi:hypothetical protein
VTKDRDMEWRLVANKGRESCRWQTADASGWVALTLGAQGDITKVVVASSDGRSEVVEGYEQGLNLARRWRNEWRQTESPRSSSSGPWLPPLPGRAPDSYGEDATPPSYPPESMPQRSTIPPDPATRSTAPLSPTSNRHRSGAESSPLSPVKSASDGQAHSRNSQSLPPARPITGQAPTLTAEDKAAMEGRERSWPPRHGTASQSGRSVNRPSGEISTESEPEHPTKPTSDPPRNPFGRGK